MASSWGTSWGTSWGVSWGGGSPPPPPVVVVGGAPPSGIVTAQNLWDAYDIDSDEQKVRWQKLLQAVREDDEIADIMKVIIRKCY